MFRKLLQARELVMSGTILLAVGCPSVVYQAVNDPRGLGWFVVGALFFAGLGLFVVAFVAIRDSERRRKIFRDAMTTLERRDP